MPPLSLDHVKDFATFEQEKTLIVLAALQMDPANSSHILTLEYAFFAIASRPVDKFQKNLPTPTQIVKHLNGSIAFKQAGMGRLNDPFPTSFTISLPFFGGMQTIFPGLRWESPFLLTAIARALERTARGSEEMASIIRTVASIVRLVDDMVKVAGLKANMAPQLSEGINCASSDHLDGFLKSVVIDRQRLQLFNLSESDLEPITCSVDDFNIKYHPEHNVLSIRPLLKLNDILVVSNAHTLISALCIWMADVMVGELGHMGATKLYQECVSDLSFEGACRFGGNSLNNEELPAIDNIRVPTFCRQGGDVVYLYYFIGCHVPNGQRSPQAPPLLDVAEECQTSLASLRALRKALLVSHSMTEVIGVLLFQPMGPIAASVDKEPDVPVLCMMAFEHEVISRLEMGNQLALYQYWNARRKNITRRATPTFTVLDDYWLYYSNDHSYYMSDDKIDFISIQPNSFQKLMDEYYSKHADHAILSPHNGSYLRVLRAFDHRVPIYFAMNCSDSVVEYVVDAKPWPIWITGQCDPGTAARFRELVEMIAYWVWQTIASWERLSLTLSTMPKLYFSYNEISEKNILQFSWPDERHPLASMETSKWFFGKTNVDEKRLVCDIFWLICDRSEARNIYDNCLPEFDSSFRPSTKKKISVHRWEERPELEPNGIGPSRFIQEYDAALVLDEVGEHCTSELHGPVTYTTKEEKLRLLRVAVDYLFGKIENELMSFSKRECILYLMARHEPLVVRQSLQDLNLGWRVACFGQDILEYIEKEVQELTTSAISVRVLIEFRAALGDGSPGEMTLSSFDRLMALMNSLIDYASESDLIYYDIADYSLSLLPSGRIGGERRKHGKALGGFRRSFVAGKVFRQSAVSPSPVPHGMPSPLEFSAACVDEFGLTAEEIDNVFLGMAVVVGRICEGGSGSMPRAQLIEEVSNLVHIDSPRIELALKILEMPRRSGLLDVPNGYRIYDIHPWKMNRDLSYIRRPVILFGDIVCVAPRHICASWRNFKGLITSGRLRARTSKMKSLISAIRNATGKAFAHEVASFIQARRPDLSVTIGIKKFGTIRLAEGGMDLGDIDVLLLDPMSRTIICLECKNLESARNPHELSSELKSFVRGAPGSFIDKILARHRWMRGHRDEIRRHFKMRGGSWSVRSFIVVDQDVMSKRVSRCEIDVIALHELERSLLRLANRRKEL